MSVRERVCSTYPFLPSRSLSLLLPILCPRYHFSLFSTSPYPSFPNPYPPSPFLTSTFPLPSLPQQDERDLEVTGIKQKKETALIIDTEEKATKILFQSLSDTASSTTEDSVFRAIQFMDKRYTLSTYSVLTPPVVPSKIESFGVAEAVAVTETKTETVAQSPVKGKMHYTFRILFDTL